MSIEDLDQSFRHAMAAFQSGQWRLATQSFRAITERWPECKEAWFQLGLVYQRQGAWLAAVDMFEQVLERDSEVQEVYFNLGMISLNQGKPTLAATYWLKSLAINPDYYEASYQLALLYAQSGKEQDAVTILSDLLAQNAELKMVLLSMLREQLQRGQTLEAEAIFKALDSNTSWHGPERALLNIQIQLIHESQAKLEACFDAPDLDWVQPLKELYCHKQAPQKIAVLPHQYLADLPRDSAWYRGDIASINAWLLNSAQWPVQKYQAVSRQKKRPTLLLILDAQGLLWQEWYRLHLKALPAHWDIHILLRHNFLQGLLQTDTLSDLGQVSLLSEELPIALKNLQEASADIILFSNPELDPLQFWLAQTRLAPLQLAWSAVMPESDFSPTSQAALDGSLPLWPLSPLTVQTPATDSNSYLVLLDSMGLSATETAQLRNIKEYASLTLACSMLDLAKTRQINQDLGLPLQVWRNLSDLDRLLSEAKALVLPQEKPNPLYLGAATRKGLPFLSPNPTGLFPAHLLSESFNFKAPDFEVAPEIQARWQRWLDNLPATRWAVNLQAWHPSQPKRLIF